MKLVINAEANIIAIEGPNQENEVIPLYSAKGFQVISSLWTKVGWNQKYSYTFTWMGRPIIQLPEDLVRIQEVIYRIKPDLIIETGVAHGGSLIYYASLCKAMGKGRVVGIDIEISPHNRNAMERHELSPYITLVEGDSTSRFTVEEVKRNVRSQEAVMLILDSNHTKNHVLKELQAYHDLVTAGSYIVITDGIMKDLHDVPRGKPEWVRYNPCEAAQIFLKEHPEYVMETPSWLFNESDLNEGVTYWPRAWLRKTRQVSQFKSRHL